MSLNIHNNYAPITHIEDSTVYIDSQGKVIINSPQHRETEDAVEVDTSFFRTDLYTLEKCESELREALTCAKSKADACHKIRQLEYQRYITISNLSDQRKAELINQYSQPQMTFTGDDFRKERNS